MADLRRIFRAVKTLVTASFLSLAAPAFAFGSGDLCSQAFDRVENRYSHTAKLDSEFLGEDRGKMMEFSMMDFIQRIEFNVRYLTEDEADSYRIYVKDGKLIDQSGALIDTTYVQTDSNSLHYAIYVMRTNGDLLLSMYQDTGKFHHSSLAGGGPVAAAGEIKIYNGELIAINDGSGHYKPSARESAQVVEELKRRGLVFGQSVPRVNFRKPISSK